MTLYGELEYKDSGPYPVHLAADTSKSLPRLASQKRGKPCRFVGGLYSQSFLMCREKGVVKNRGR